MPPPAGKWPDNWRELAVGDLPENATDEQKAEHDKAMKLAKRYDSPAALLKAQREAQRRISSGELKAPLAKDATPEQVKQWRAENGIPETPEGYKIELPKGLVLGDNDKPHVDEFIKTMHGKNTPPDVVNEAVAWYVQNRESQIAAMQEHDKEYRAKFEDTLHSEWGGEYRTNLKGVETMVSQWPEDARQALLSARTADGFLVEHPAVMQALAAQARELGYVGATVPMQGADLGASVEDAIAAMEKTMFKEDGSKNPAYWNSDKAQAKYSDLLEARKRHTK